jgi:hypothetical protein
MCVDVFVDGAVSGNMRLRRGNDRADTIAVAKCTEAGYAVKY